MKLGSLGACLHSDIKIENSEFEKLLTHDNMANSMINVKLVLKLLHEKFELKNSKYKTYKTNCLLAMIQSYIGLLTITKL